MDVVPAIQKAMGSHSESAFELFGFDFMFDKKLNPTLVEVNRFEGDSANQRVCMYGASLL